MGTRGAFGVVIGEKEKIGYNQFDSYPGGHGVEVLGWLRDVVAAGELERVRAQAEALRVVAGDEPVTTEDFEALRPYVDLEVSEQSTDDWYCLTRLTHGSIAKTLECGYVLDSSAFPLDSLFCEWAYIVDLDAGVFEVYKGFQHEPPTTGRFAGRLEEGAGTAGRTAGYHEVALAARWSLDDLPSDEHFLEVLSEDEEEYEEE